MSVSSTASLAHQVARVAGHRIAESVRPGRLAAPGTVPIGIDNITTDWLTAALCSSTPGAQVRGFTVSEGSAGTSARHPVTVEYNSVGADAGLPTELFTKTTPDMKTRLFTGLSDLFVGECNFYNLIRPRLTMEAPFGYHCDYDRGSCRSIVVMEDIARTRGAQFGSPQTLHIDRSRALDMASTMASYHSAFWDLDLDSEFNWLRTSSEWQRHLDSIINTEAMVRRGIKRAHDVLPRHLLRRADTIWPAFVTSLDLKVRGPVTLLHHDVHSKNWYVNAEGKMGLFDWQTIAAGTWAIDFSYAINCGLAIDDRREWLPEILDHYLDSLSGVSRAPAPAEARLLYRQQSIHGLIFWLATIGAGRFQPDLHDEKDCLINIERLASAVDDEDTLDALLNLR